MASSSKRHSIMPPSSQAGPKPPVKFSSSITIADAAVLTGSNEILISSESVIHPRAKIDSLGGPINIGRRCIVHERTVVGAPVDGAIPTGHGVTMGDYVTVEVGSVIETGGTVIGDDSIIGVACRIGTGATIGRVRSPDMLASRI